MNKFVYNKPKFLIHNIEFEKPTKLACRFEKYSAEQIQAKLCIFLLKEREREREPKFFSLPKLPLRIAIGDDSFLMSHTDTSNGILDDQPL